MVEKVLGSPFSFAGHGVESRLGSSFWVVLFDVRTLVASASSLDGSFLSFHSQICATLDRFLDNSVSPLSLMSSSFVSACCPDQFVFVRSGNIRGLSFSCFPCLGSCLPLLG
ncbi:hypothetical protein ISN45_Aa03g004110 [Arabidopsis thaliana x Arabidopsis arenosa]|uniref:Uncharacterized protein n=1 Tax=Arabidopsis thaliana x Arabidopsis arenosa TaxID=1240361 RepID=A0A8T2AN52_9BRAS|nr:hypothetical protein ISN45_Aa03g004110 [Arabidopsis thaliana x Arabidopsis arenosa]